MKKMSAIIHQIQRRNRGDYLVFLKKGLAWKYYREQQLMLNAKRGL